MKKENANDKLKKWLSFEDTKITEEALRNITNEDIEKAIKEARKDKD